MFRRGGELGNLVESLREGFVLCRMIRDDQGRIVDYIIADANAAYLAGLGGRSVLGKRLLEVRPDIRADWFDICANILEGKKPKRLEYWDPKLDRWFDTNMTPISADELIMLYVDVTHRKRREERAKERLQELNHRVKNNLNLVGAMLTLQARSAAPETRRALEQAVARVHTISEVHNLLHRVGSDDRVDLGQYLEDLADKLQNSIAPRHVRIQCQTESVLASLEKAIELGVIANELLTNALKYAYPEGAPGIVELRARRVGGDLMLTVRDFGVGALNDIGTGLGMKLVRSIVRQNGGRISVPPTRGVTVEIVLPLNGQ